MAYVVLEGGPDVFPALKNFTSPIREALFSVLCLFSGQSFIVSTFGGFKCCLRCENEVCQNFVPENESPRFYCVIGWPCLYTKLRIWVSFCEVLISARLLHFNGLKNVPERSSF